MSNGNSYPILTFENDQRFNSMFFILLFVQSVRCFLRPSVKHVVVTSEISEGIVLKVSIDTASLGPNGFGILHKDSPRH